MSETKDPFEAPFGSIFSDKMAMASMVDGVYSYPNKVQPLQNLSLHPGAHALHYGSTCFEGLKAHRQPDGSVAIFRLDDHVNRMIQSITKLRMVAPEFGMLRTMFVDAVTANVADTPANPGSLYIRPTAIGTLENVGAAASPSTTALLYVITSPVGDYFAGGIRPLSIFVETETPRTTPQFGMIKTGANYAMALGLTLDAKKKHGVDQVLFATSGDVTETGASNFFLVSDRKLITRDLDESFLHGVTRNSLITLGQHLGYEIEERAISLEEIKRHAESGEAFLSGTAAVIAPVGKLKLHGEEVVFGTGEPGQNTLRLRQALTDIQTGAAADTSGWLTAV